MSLTMVWHQSHTVTNEWIFDVISPTIRLHQYKQLTQLTVSHNYIITFYHELNINSWSVSTWMEWKALEDHTSIHSNHQLTKTCQHFLNDCNSNSYIKLWKAAATMTIKNHARDRDWSAERWLEQLLVNFKSLLHLSVSKFQTDPEVEPWSAKFWPNDVIIQSKHLSSVHSSRLSRHNGGTT